MTSIIDSLYYKGDTLFVSYKINEQYCYIDTARDGTLIYSGLRTARTVVESATFTQHISVPKKTKYIYLDNHDYSFFFVKDGFRKYRLNEYHLEDSTIQTRVQCTIPDQCKRCLFTSCPSNTESLRPASNDRKQKIRLKE